MDRKREWFWSHQCHFSRYLVPQRVPHALPQAMTGTKPRPGLVCSRRWGNSRHGSGSATEPCLSRLSVAARHLVKYPDFHRHLAL